MAYKTFIFTIVLFFHCLVTFHFVQAEEINQEITSELEAVPIVGGVVLNGVGLIYGGGFQVNHMFGKGSRLLAGATGGNLRSYGLLLADVPIFFPSLTFGFASGVVDHAEYDTVYARGLDKGFVFRQHMQGRASLFTLKYQAIEGRLFLNARFFHSWARFKEFENLAQQTIPFRRNDLHDIESTAPSIGILGYIISPVNSQNELSLGVNLTSLSGRIAQSDMDLYNIKLKGLFALTNKWTLAVMTQLQMASITKEAGPGGPNGDCGSITDSTLQSQCQQIEGDFRDFVTASNRYGTSLPVGGSRGLRSFREFRFRAANTGFTGLELRRDFKFYIPLQMATFYELGQAHDLFSQLFTRSVQSYGFGLRGFVSKELPVRLEYAHGDEGSVVFFTVGYPW